MNTIYITGHTSSKIHVLYIYRSSSAAAATAFAVATAGSANPKDHPKGINRYPSAGTGTSGGDCLKPGNSHHNLNKKRESVISTAATMRVLNVMRHWVSKHSQVR